MFKPTRFHRYLLLPALLLLLALAVSVSASPKSGAMTVDSLTFLGTAEFPTGTSFGETEVGGLSGITYDDRRGVYYALSDDRSHIDRVIELTITPARGTNHLNTLTCGI